MMTTRSLARMSDLIIECNKLHKMPDEEYDNINWSKIKGNPEPGHRIEIHENNKSSVTFGYLFIFPEQDGDDYDMCIHVPEENLYFLLYAMVVSPNVKEIKIL